MALFIWNSKNSYMDSPKQAKFPMINWINIWTNLDMSRHSSLLSCGGTKHTPSIFTIEWRWGKIWEPILYYQYTRWTKNNLQYLLWLGMQAILWNKFIVELLQKGSAGINDKLCDQITGEISSPHPASDPICTPSRGAPKLWCFKATEKPLVYLTANTRGTQSQDSTNSGKFPILCMRYGILYAEITQRNSLSTGSPN